jgi:hypothetical protein
MTLLRFLLWLFVFIGSVAAAGALIFSLVLILRFPPLLIIVLLTFWIMSRLRQMAARTLD